MTMRACPTCSSRVPTSNLRCFQCKQLLPSMLQQASDPEAPRQLYIPDRPYGTGPLRAPDQMPVAGGTGKLVRLIQSFAGRK